MQIAKPWRNVTVKVSLFLAFLIYLHLGTAILEPELNLSGFQAKPFAKLQSLFLIRMRALLEQANKTKTKNKSKSKRNQQFPFFTKTKSKLKKKKKKG
jgi:hypothetical protein